MNADHIKDLAEDLEREVEDAKSKGYENADCVLTEEMRGLLVLARAGMITTPVDLKFTAGPSRNFSETRLGECKELEAAWAAFRAAVEDWDSRPAYRMLKARIEAKQPFPNGPSGGSKD